MKARSIARELSLLGISQLSDSRTEDPRVRAAVSKSTRSVTGGTDTLLNTPITDKPTTEQLDALLLKALTTLSADAQETIETAEGELQRGERLVLESETRTIDSREVQSRIQPAIPLIEAAINRVGEALELLMFVQQEDRKGMISVKNALKAAAKSVEAADQLMADYENRIVDIEQVRSQIENAISILKAALPDVQKALPDVQKAISNSKKALVSDYLSQLINNEDARSYACDLIYGWIRHWQEIDIQLDEAMEKWNIRRLARVDRDILRLAMIEIVYLDVPKKVAVDEAVEMAKRYSDEDGYRFINGVLRRTTDKLEKAE